MRFRIRNIRSILFSTYSLIIAVIFTILVLWFYWWASDVLRKNATDSIDSLVRSMQQKLDAEMQKMNDVSLNVMYSNLVKNQFKLYMANLEQGRASGDNSAAEAASAVESAKELADILTAAIGPSRPVEQLYLYDFKNSVYGNGFDNGRRAYDPAAKPWFEKVVGNTTGKVIGAPVPDEDMTRFVSSSETQYSVSLYRLFYDRYNVPQGIIEVKQYYDRIFQTAREYSGHNASGGKALVFDDDGRILFPLGEPQEQYAALIGTLRGLPGSDGRSVSFRNPATGEKELVAFRHSDFLGWNTAIIVSERKLLAPLSLFAKQTVVVAFAILLFAILLSFLAAKRITLPILKIHRAIRNMRLEDLGSGRGARTEWNSGLNELDQLHGSFVQMSVRLKQSMDELLLSQSQELQAKLVALQAQMNPHFLYNALATISVMAEENMNEQIVAMSENMSDILRYISSDEPQVLLEKELQHTEQYLQVLQIRHGAKLRYTVDVDPRILQLKAPKLIVQPLVENALKFGTKLEPPWTIRIEGAVRSYEWTIAVSDNGPGFDAASLERLYASIGETDRTNAIPALKLDGMGLLNTYIRLKLYYGASAVFRIDNREGGGAVVTIGGRIEGATT